MNPHTTKTSQFSALKTAENPSKYLPKSVSAIYPLNAEFGPICHLLALFWAHHILHVSRWRVKCRL